MVCKPNLQQLRPIYPVSPPFRREKPDVRCKQAALAFLGRTCMLQKDWKSGAKAFHDIMELGDNAINANYQELFYPSTGTSNKENIFYIQYLENYLGTGLPQHALSAKDGGWTGQSGC